MDLINTAVLVESRDVVDFKHTDISKSNPQINLKRLNVAKDNLNNPHTPQKTTTGNYCEIEMSSRVKSSFSTFEQLPIFHFRRKSSDGKDRPLFTKSTSLVKMLGNTYNTKSLNTEEVIIGPSNCLERFQKCSENEFTDDKTNSVCTRPEMNSRSIRTLSKGLGRLLWKRSYSIDISEPDPEFKVSYLGNVLTGWAKGMYFNTYINN